ncbi:uncharacterized protein METZ01_LOCUS45066, partial [marine metagenome]
VQQIGFDTGLPLWIYQESPSFGIKLSSVPSQWDSGIEYPPDFLPVVLVLWFGADPPPPTQ